MGFRILYKNLFEIRILHHYFLDAGETGWDALEPDLKNKIFEKYDIRDILEIVPTNECLKSLEAHRCIFKATPTGILIGIKSEEDEIQPGVFNPFIIPSDDLVFRFLVRLKDLNFSGYSALPLQNQNGLMFIFKNHAAVHPAKFPALSAIPPSYNAGTTYYPGDMLSDDPADPEKIFTALIKTTSNTTIDTDWLTEEADETTPISYANINDKHVAVNGILNYQVKVQDVNPEATFKKLNGETIAPRVEALPGDFYTLQADLRHFPQGFYSLHVESSDHLYQDDLDFYLFHESEVPFGLIEIKVKSDQAGYDLLDQGHLLSPTFELRFRNRRTHWRYSGKFFSTPFILEDPLPLTRNGQIEITKPPEPGDTKIIMLPNPSDPVIKPEALIKTDENKYYSDIHII